MLLFEYPQSVHTVYFTNLAILDLRTDWNEASFKNIKSQTMEHILQIVLVVEIFYRFYWCWCCYDITTRSFSIGRRGSSSRGRTNRSRIATPLLWRWGWSSPFDEPVGTADVHVIADCRSIDRHWYLLPFRSLAWSGRIIIINIMSIMMQCIQCRFTSFLILGKSGGKFFFDLFQIRQ